MTARLLSFFLLLALAIPTRASVIESFRYLDNKAVATAWRAIASAPAPERAADGVLFHLPFDGERERVYWDKTVSLDLSRDISFELELTCERPEAIRTLMIYLKSGDGWYVWGRSLKTAGRQRISLARQDFSVEGKPAGWNKIEAIRISPWRGAAVATRLTLHRFETRSDQLLIIRSENSAPNATERNVASRATDRVSRWLEDVGIRHAILPESQLTADRLRGVKLVILPYNARPTAAQLALYRAHINAGGKLIVCFSDSTELANLMGISLGEVVSHREPGRWAGFAFGDSDAKALHIPQHVYQQAWGIRIAQPQKGRGRVLARWMDATGKAQPEPAWIATDRGYWMTQILLDDDRAGKEQLLLGLVAALEPGAWSSAAQYAAANVGKIDGFANFVSAINGIRSLAAGHPERDGIETLLAQAERAHQTMLTALAKSDAATALNSARTAHDQLTRAYSRAQRAPAKEVRGVWDHDGVGWYPGDWDRTARDLKAAGINTLFVNTLWAGLAHYPSKIVPESHTYRKFGDQMKAASAAARKYGLEIHAWVVLWQINNAPPEFQAQMRKEGRLQQAADGTKLTWLNPVLEANQRYMLSAIEELARNYDLDGIHLDYVRYPDANADFSPATRAAFERSLGRASGAWPASVRNGGANQDRFRTWRAGVITDFVKATRRSLKQIKPDLKLSAAVWGGYPDTIASIGQDWGAWLRDGQFDFVCPMNYADDTYKFSALTQKQVTLPGAKNRIIPGIGVTAAESQLSADKVIEQIAIARRLGTPGFALYKLSQTLREETLPILSEGTTK